MNTAEKPWYIIDNVQDLDSPALVIYRSRVQQNIDTLANTIDDIARLRPHVKTHKSPEVSALLLKAGITKFKCATIAEAEMLAMVSAPDVLMAYQPVGPKGERLAVLVQQFPQTKFSCLIDNPDSATFLSETFQRRSLSIDVYIDLNVGMNRTGILPEDALSLFRHCASLEGVSIVGLHAYDGHIRDTDFVVRKKQCDECFARVVKAHQEIKETFDKELIIVAGGTPSYSIHSKRKHIECSPGTFIYWDKGYEAILTEQQFSFAVLIVTRIISRPTPDTICVDLGHKAISSENPIENRVSFLNAPYLTPIGHSEEHMIFKVKDGNNYQVGDVLYGLPYHVCPTVALHDHTAVVDDNTIVEYWSTFARNRKITV